MRHTLAELRSGELLGIKALKIQEDLEVFPQEIFTLSESLELLDLSGNRLQELPSLARLTKLKIAFFSQNEFEEVPDAFKECSNLYMLGLKSNAIERFDEDILPLSISWLILTDNRLTKLPNSIGDLINMEKFPLAGNRLSSLPESMQKMKNLALLRISANAFEVIPSWLVKLPKLAYFSFSGNPCSKSKAPNIKTLAMDDLKIGSLLGEGASGKIYQADSKAFNRLIALKLFKGSVTSDGYAEDEMNASMAAGSHPNLIKVLARLEQGHLGLVMEFIAANFHPLGNPPNFETCSRDTYKSDFTIKAEEILAVAKAVADVGAHLHSKGLLHGDLYAHNILVDSRYNLYLGDFGATTFYKDSSMAFEKIEVLAFGNLLDDLLRYCEDRENPLYTKLSQLRDKTTLSEVEKRPLFSKIL